MEGLVNFYSRRAMIQLENCLLTMVFHEKSDNFQISATFADDLFKRLLLDEKYVPGKAVLDSVLCARFVIFQYNTSS